MSSRKGRGAKLRSVPAEGQASSAHQMVSPNLSAIERASFLEELQLNHGNPLHSTAMEEDLNALEEGQVDKERAGGKDVPEMLMRPSKRRRAAVNRKDTEKDGEQEKKRSRRSNGEKVQARPVTNQPMKRGMKRESESARGKSSNPQSQEESDSGTSQQSHESTLSSDEEAGEDTSWKRSPKKANVYSFGRTRKSGRSRSRKSSSGSASAEPEQASSDKQRKRRPAGQAGTDLEVVLDAFLHFCDQYRESVESKAVKQSIDSFSSNVKEKLLAKISLYKELRVLKRENAKVGSLIHTKTQKLLNAKHELMRAERQVRLLQKEEAELKLRLADLRRSRAFLHDMRGLNQRYLDHRRQHPKERETYGASSLPALLLEAKHIQATERQLRKINNRMEKRLKKNQTCK